MTQLSFSVLGIKTEKNVFNEDACRAGQLLSDIIIGSWSIFNSIFGLVEARSTIFNIFKDRWKYRLFTDTNVYEGNYKIYCGILYWIDIHEYNFFR